MMKSEETHKLCRDELTRLDGEVAGRVISCRKGVAWLTPDGHSGGSSDPGRRGLFDRPSRPGPDQRPGGIRLHGIRGKTQFPWDCMALHAGYPANGAPFRGGEKKSFGLTIDILPLILPLYLSVPIRTG